MLFVVIQPNTVAELAKLLALVDKRADGVEIRLDSLPAILISDIRTLVTQVHLPFILTVRSKAHGGFFPGTEKEREKIIQELLALEPPFLDVEYDMDPAFLNHLQPGKTKLVCSYHNFAQTPLDLEGIFVRMEKDPAYLYKIATMAHSTCDALRMLEFVRTQSHQGKRVTGICMGEDGHITRILGPVIGNVIDYAALSDAHAAAPGQLTVATLCDTYRYKTLNTSTHIYGLIGDPVASSPSHITHNQMFGEKKLNAVYVKMRVKDDELSSFFSHIQTLPFRGLSVTMPLKESIMAYLGEMSTEAKTIGAVNTLCWEEGIFKGYNTDGKGALNALEAHTPTHTVQNKTIVILGAGGAAKAIAFEAHKRKARVIIVNRSLDKATALAKKVGGEGLSLDQMPSVCATGYDILINTTPIGMAPHLDELPIDPQWILPGCMVMDIISTPKETALLGAAKEKGCTLIYGLDMFKAQAAEQFRLWHL